MDATFTRRSKVTAEEAWGLDVPGLWELVDGQVVPMSPAGARHGDVVASVARLLGNFVGARRLGRVLAGDAGFVLRRNPDTVRAPDVAFVTAARLPGRPPAEFMSGAPDLAIEVVSPSDDWKAVDKKAAEFIAAGARAVWAIDPGTESAKVYTGAGSRVLAPGEVLACPELLGEFELRLPDLWA
jgi:Uma2 family endonuclease